MGSWKRISFQNISCYCLTQLESERWEDEHISKHLMLLFNDTMYRPVYSHIYISKHLMLLFNNYAIVHFFQNNNISKHLMLLFNLDILKTFNDPDLFQNISCYCLTGSMIAVAIGLLYFKTSHVIV